MVLCVGCGEVAMRTQNGKPIKIYLKLSGGGARGEGDYFHYARFSAIIKSL